MENIFKQLRKQHGYSQQELADLLFVNQTAVSQWERGVTTPNKTTLLKLAKLYNVSADVLLHSIESERARNTDFFGVSTDALLSHTHEPSEYASTNLHPDEKELLELFRALPASEKENTLNTRTQKVWGEKRIGNTYQPNEQ